MMNCQPRTNQRSKCKIGNTKKKKTVCNLRLGALGPSNNLIFSALVFLDFFQDPFICRIFRRKCICNFYSINNILFTMLFWRKCLSLSNRTLYFGTWQPRVSSNSSPWMIEKIAWQPTRAEMWQLAFVLIIHQPLHRCLHWSSWERGLCLNARNTYGTLWLAGRPIIYHLSVRPIYSVKLGKYDSSNYLFVVEQI